jgi:hypothetical protein
MSTELTYPGTPLSQMFRLHLRTVLPNLPMDSGQTLMREKVVDQRDVASSVSVVMKVEVAK